jgi:hypothetical protein
MSTISTPLLLLLSQPVWPAVSPRQGEELRDLPALDDVSTPGGRPVDEPRDLRTREDFSAVGELLHEAGETHHRVYRITDGAHDDWASWYAEWLVTLSELPELLGAKVSAVN